MTSALLSIHPIYAEKILSGIKKIEIRKTAIKKEIDYIVIYETFPVCKITGYSKVSAVSINATSDVCRSYLDKTALSLEELLEYCGSHEYITMIHLSESFRIVPHGISEIFSFNLPPQSFRYISDEEFELVSKLIK